MPFVLKRNRQGFEIKTVRLSLRRGVLTKDSLISFTFDNARFGDRLGEKLLAGLLSQGGKIGFRIARGQRIKHLEVAGMRLTSNSQISREFTRTFGAASGEQWVGFPILGKPVLLGNGFKTTLKVTFRPRTRAAFQMVPIVISFGGQQLARHHVLGLSVLQRGPVRVDSLVEVVTPK